MLPWFARMVIPRKPSNEESQWLRLASHFKHHPSLVALAQDRRRHSQTAAEIPRSDCLHPCRSLRKSNRRSKSHLLDQAEDAFHFLPVNRWYASMYFSRVFATTWPGSGGGGLFRSQLVVIKYSRTNCLSKEAWGPPG